MSVDVETEISGSTAVELTDQERVELDVVATHLAAVRPSEIDAGPWMHAARELSNGLPARLRQALRRFAWNSGPDAALLIRNLPVRPDELPDTPTMAGSVQRTATVPASAQILVALHLGEIIAFREEKYGALVQDVVPVPGMEKFQGNAGSVKLSMHVENAFHAHRPDYIGLHCLRNDHDNAARLKTASIRRALPLLPQEVRETLHEPRFITEPPASFGAVATSPVPHGILSGSPQDPDIKIDFTSTHPQDTQAEQAMAMLGEALVETGTNILLEPGDLAFLDNRLALHGRTAFEPRYDGRDRWLQRVFVQRDFRRSRELRSHNGYVLSSQDNQQTP